MKNDGGEQVCSSEPRSEKSQRDLAVNSNILISIRLCSKIIVKNGMSKREK